MKESLLFVFGYVLWLNFFLLEASHQITSKLFPPNFNYTILYQIFPSP